MASHERRDGRMGRRHVVRPLGAQGTGGAGADRGVVLGRGAASRDRACRRHPGEHAVLLRVELDLVGRADVPADGVRRLSLGHDRGAVRRSEGSSAKGAGGAGHFVGPCLLGLFTVVSLAGIIIRVPIISLTHRPFVEIVESIAFLTLYAERIGENMALALSVLIVMFWNFFVNRYWTYNDVE